MEQNPMKPVTQRGRRRVHTPAAMQRIKQALVQVTGRGGGGTGAYSMPSTTTRAKSGHQVFAWSLNNRRALVTRALALGVLVSGKTPEAVGKPGKGQFRSWKTLAAAVERAERGVQVDEISVPVDVPTMRDHFRKISAEVASE